jgi:hypothetical protein
MRRNSTETFPRGTNRAAVAVKHSMLVIIHHLLTCPGTYHDLGGTYFDERERDSVRRRFIGRLSTPWLLSPTPATIRLTPCTNAGFSPQSLANARSCTGRLIAGEHVRLGVREPNRLTCVARLRPQAFTPGDRLSLADAGAPRQRGPVTYEDSSCWSLAGPMDPA